jgi:hypothetical protein
MLYFKLKSFVMEENKSNESSKQLERVNVSSPTVTDPGKGESPSPQQSDNRTANPASPRQPTRSPTDILPPAPATTYLLAAQR